MPITWLWNQPPKPPEPQPTPTPTPTPTPLLAAAEQEQDHCERCARPKALVDSINEGEGFLGTPVEFLQARQAQQNALTAAAGYKPGGGTGAGRGQARGLISLEHTGAVRRRQLQQRVGYPYPKV